MSTVQGRAVRDQVKTPTTGKSEYYLEIVKGKTAHPIRPIEYDRYLIGAGDWCDLCLGGSKMPVLHSVIHVDGENVWIDAVASGAGLKVNGESTTFSELQPGDRIEIGAFTLKFARRASSVAQKAPARGLYEPIPEAAFDEEEVDLAKMSASELVDLIECDMELVDEFERRKRRGTEALLDAVKRHRNTTAVPEISEQRVIKPLQAPVTKKITSQPAVEIGVDRLAQLFKDLQGTISSIGQLAQSLEQRSKTMSPQQVNAAAASLLEFQEQVVSRLDDVLAKVAAQTKSSEPKKRQREAA